MLVLYVVDFQPRFNFAIFVAGFKSRSSPHDVLYTEPISLPTLHVFGDTDKVIPKGNKLSLFGNSCCISTHFSGVVARTKTGEIEYAVPWRKTLF